MPDSRRTRVLIVDDSPFVRKALLRIFEREPSIDVVGAARNGKEALEKTLLLKPDVVTLDIMMPVMDGIDTLKAIMERYPVPVLILSQFTHEGAELTLKALELGAMDFVDKSSTGIMDFLSLANEIVTKVKAISRSKPVRLAYESSHTLKYASRGIVDVVAIGASTGGPPALQMILQKFPKDITFGILIVQHMPKGFTASLAARLDSLCAFRVKEAEEGDKIEHGLALVAPSGLHMKVGKGAGSVRLDVEPLNAIHRPSADVLFRSVSDSYGSRSIGVILTGMGADGAKGIVAIKNAGGKTISQDEATSTIFGMPKVAIESGKVDRVLPITEIAEEILRSS
ncbi:MAG: chemotaxis response regulator protein-glutamate methylesterase [Thermodesulfovibrionales bacterium]|nr:chemotaxis response regulator protein-glutamate methylesterase [Thermodesulfovibrionales bacterium]